MPKDIRSFFGPKKDDGKKAEKRPADGPIDLTEEEPQKSAAKKQKTSTPVKADKRPPPPAKKPPTPAKKATPKKTTPAKKPTPRKAAAKGKSKAQVVDSESEAEEEASGSEEAYSAGEDESSEDSDLVMDVDEVSPAPKATRKASKAAKPAQPAASKKPEPPAPSPAKPAAAKRPLPASFTASAAKPAAKDTPKTTAKRAKAVKEELSSDAKAAIKAVDAAVKLLPEIKVDLDSADAFGQGGSDAEPPNLGSKEIPRGQPECLKDKVFVITGVLDSLWRNDAEDLIKRHSGRVTGSVSGKTTFLLTGTQPGRSKISAAADKGTKIIDEDGLISLIKAAPDPAAAAAPAEDSGDDVAFVSAAAPSGARPASAKAQLNKAPGTSSKATGSRPAAAPAARPPGHNNGQLWVEKYRPKSMDELVGNPTIVGTLRSWLESWEGVHLRGEEAAAQKGRGKPKDMTKKAVLMSGPPGIGKTTSAMIITRALGYQPVEINASDTRNKADSKITGGMAGKLANAVKEMCTNTAIGMDAQGRRKKICLVMDEVDGMSGGDRGGVGELIGIIKSSKVPIICICNDNYNQKLKSLRNSCLELVFRKPSADQIAKRAAYICKQEGLSVNESTLQCVAAGANGDIRLVLGQLQMIRLRSTSLSYDDAKSKMGNSKDADMSPFEAGRRLLSMETTRMSLLDRTELVFQDMDLVPLLIQENYLNHRPTMANNNEAIRLQLVAKAADAFSLGDIVNRSVRQHQNWSLMPFGATVGSVLPATYMRGSRETFYGENNFPRFTAWLGQNSSYGKQRRLLGELHTRMSASGKSTVDRTGMRTDYLPTFRKTLIKPLVERERLGIDDVIYEMQDYCLNKDDHQFILDVTQFKSKAPGMEDPYKNVPTAVKSAFTRQLNQSIAHTRPKSNIMVEEFKRGGRLRTKAPKAVEEDDELGGDPELEAAAAAERRAKQEEEGSEEELDSEEEEWNPKDAKEVAKKQRQMARSGITFESKLGGGSAKGKRGGGGGGRGGAAKGRGRGRGK